MPSGAAAASASVAWLPGAAAPLSSPAGEGAGGEDISLTGVGAEAGVAAAASEALGEGADDDEDEVAASGDKAGASAGEGAGGEGGELLGSCAKTPEMATKMRARTITWRAIFASCFLILASLFSLSNLQLLFKWITALSSYKKVDVGGES